MIMKTLNQYIKEKLIINKDYRDNTIVVKSFDELTKIIEDRYDKFGAGTEQNPIDFNDIDVSNIDSFYSSNRAMGIFQKINFKYIDISDWDVSNVRTMNCMFAYCIELKSVGDISKWNVSKVTNMYCMFLNCKFFNQDLSGWDVSNVTNMAFMFYDCESFNQDISKWDVSNVTDAINMFEKCPIKNEYKPKFK